MVILIAKKNLIPCFFGEGYWARETFIVVHYSGQVRPKTGPASHKERAAHARRVAAGAVSSPTRSASPSAAWPKSAATPSQKKKKALPLSGQKASE
jgi:hypothetical protein